MARRTFIGNIYKKVKDPNLVTSLTGHTEDYLTARKYWNKLKQRLLLEGNETVTNCHQLNQMQDPELGIKQSLMDYKRLGYSDNWINQRLKSIEIRKDLTDQWKAHNVQEGVQYATLLYQHVMETIESDLFDDVKKVTFKIIPFCQSSKP